MKDIVIKDFIETDKFRQIYVYTEAFRLFLCQHTSLKTQVQANNSKLVS